MGHGGHQPQSSFHQRAAAGMGNSGMNKPDRSFQSDDVLLYLTAILGITLPGLVFMCYSAAFRWYGYRFGGIIRPPFASTTTPTVDVPETTDDEDTSHTVTKETPNGRTAVIMYASETGVCKALALSLARALVDKYKVFMTDMSTVTVDDLVDLDVTMVVFIVSTWIDGCAPTACVPFSEEIKDVCRSSDVILSSLTYGMFAVGNSMYECSYNTFGRSLHQQLLQLDARPFMTLALGDESKNESIIHQFGVWQKNLLTLCDDPRRIEQAATSMHSRRVATLEEERQKENNSGENGHKTRRRRRTARQRRDLSSESEESSGSE